MRKITLYIVVLIFISLLSSCKDKSVYLKKQFFDSKNKYIGDSIFINNIIKTIVFKDSSYVIDSIVYNRYNNSVNNLKSIQTFKNGKNIFENIDYFENGNIKRYSFIDEDNSNYYYQRNYDSNGNFLNTYGYVFFKGYVTNINLDNLEVKKGTTIDYKIFYPNPPDCKAKIYVRVNDSTLFDVFHKSKYLNFLQTVVKDNNELGTYQTNILLELKQNNNDSVIRYDKTLFFKVVP